MDSLESITTKWDQYWLELLHDTDYLSDDEFKSINEDNLALKKMLSSITLTTSKNLKNF